MYVSEGTFIHLRQAADEQLNRELEYRRIAHERDGGTQPAAKRGVRDIVQRFRHAEYNAPRQLSHP
ncbi:hypothetical protein SAMN04487846_0610 [Microbacterium sp. cf046]|uniref:hypothetical protein n=1 Tax=Microbacterium sp. cf046 TaxID=1761803 RepID=UPI0008F33149|nr:hypothetical protein [Microbacterium sp. cf046]SFR92156.1 hypothetical protein SAMN04487846_0610 [Microbacterium sp. cf046]